MRELLSQVHATRPPETEGGVPEPVDKDAQNRDDPGVLLIPTVHPPDTPSPGTGTAGTPGTGTSYRRWRKPQASRSALPIHSLSSARPEPGLRENRDFPSSATVSGEQLLDDLAAVDDLDRPAERAHVLLGRVDLQGVAEAGQQVGDGDRAVLDLGAVGASRCR